MKDQKTKEQFVEFRAQGKSYQSIADELGISKQTAINWSKEMSAQIYNLKTLEMDALYQKYMMTAKARVEVFGEQLTKIRETLAQRKYDDMGTDRLFDLLLKFMSLMSEERQTLRIKLPEDEAKSFCDMQFKHQELA